MARKRRNQSRQRDHTTIARRSLHDDFNTNVLRRLVLSLHDRREFSPFDEVQSITKRQRAVVVMPDNVNKRNTQLSRQSANFGKEYFNTPAAVTVCVRRKERREVMFAKRRTGRGARSPKRRNAWSDVRCSD